MPNGSFEDILKAKFAKRPNPNFGPTEYSKAVFGIAATMAQMHSRSIIHHLLKPASVFFDDRWEAHIWDLELAEELGNSLQSKYKAIGSPKFMAPELFDDEDDNCSLAVDVYAYGVLLYTVFTDKQIFKEGERPPRGPQQLLMKVAQGHRFMRQPEIPDVYWDLITRCWQQSPANRPTFDEIVREMLESERYAFPGTDLARYREYRERMAPPARSD
jgi:serine/threonine protein kinase